jgi:hypothetical protein
LSQSVLPRVLPATVFFLPPPIFPPAPVFFATPIFLLTPQIVFWPPVFIFPALILLPAALLFLVPPVLLSPSVFLLALRPVGFVAFPRGFYVRLRFVIFRLAVRIAGLAGILLGLA